jgi:hypothetical protein
MAKATRRCRRPATARVTLFNPQTDACLLREICRVSAESVAYALLDVEASDLSREQRRRLAQAAALTDAAFDALCRIRPDRSA